MENKPWLPKIDKEQLPKLSFSDLEKQIAEDTGLFLLRDTVEEDESDVTFLPEKKELKSFFDGSSPFSDSEINASYKIAKKLLKEAVQKIIKQGIVENYSETEILLSIPELLQAKYLDDTLHQDKLLVPVLAYRGAFLDFLRNSRLNKNLNLIRAINYEKERNHLYRKQFTVGIQREVTSLVIESLHEAKGFIDSARQYAETIEHDIELNNYLPLFLRNKGSNLVEKSLPKLLSENPEIHPKTLILYFREVIRNGYINSTQLDLTENEKCVLQSACDVIFEAAQDIEGYSDHFRLSHELRVLEKVSNQASHISTIE